MRQFLALLCVLLLLQAYLPSVEAQSGGLGDESAPPPVLEHIVAPGETLFSIARRYGTTVEAITHANRIPDPRQIYTGQRLLIPSALGPVETWKTHVVRPGETLQGIARQYGVDWRRIALANSLINPSLLTAGRVLRIPGSPAQARSGALYIVQPGRPSPTWPSGWDLPSGGLLRPTGTDALRWTSRGCGFWSPACALPGCPRPSRR